MSKTIHKSKHLVLKDIEDIAESIGTMREQPDGGGNSRSVATQSVFQRASLVLKAQRESGMDEKYNKLVLTELSKMLEELIPIAETQCRKYPGDRFAAISLTNYMTQYRDIMKDLRNIQSFEQQIERLTTHNFKTFQQMVQAFADEMYRVRASVKANTPDKDFDTVDKVLMRALDNYCNYMNESLKAINSKVEEQLA